MVDIRHFNTHRTWEDWFGIVLGVLIGLSPWLAGQTDKWCNSRDCSSSIWNARKKPA